MCRLHLLGINLEIVFQRLLKRAFLEVGKVGLLGEVGLNSEESLTKLKGKQMLSLWLMNFHRRKH